PAESVENEQIEIGRLRPISLAFKRKAAVTGNDLNLRRRIGEIGEILRVGSHGNDLWIDLIKTQRVSGTGVGGDGSDAESTRADAAGRAIPGCCPGGRQSECLSQPASGGIVSRWRACVPAALQFEAVIAAAMRVSQAVVLCRDRASTHRERAVKVAKARKRFS